MSRQSPRGFAAYPGLSRSRCVAGSFSDHARSGRFFFLNRSRGSLCVPPGRQSLPRRSAGGRSPCGFARRRRRVALHLEIVALRLPRLPQLPAREPAHRDVCALPLELYERRLELLALPRAERRRLLVDQNRPVGMAGRHPAILTGSWRGACYYRGSAPKRRTKEPSGAKRLSRQCVVLAIALLRGVPALAQESDGSPTSRNVRVRIGPVLMNPTIALTNLGVDHNVFNDPPDKSPKEDFTFTVTPASDFWIHARPDLGHRQPGRIRSTGIRTMPASEPRTVRTSSAGSCRARG